MVGCINGPPSTESPSGRSLLMAANARSKSAASRTSVRNNVKPNARAEAGISFLELERVALVLGFEKDGDAGNFRHRFFEQLQTFAAEMPGDVGKTGDVAAQDGQGFRLGLPQPDRARHP